jgi:hypothetical protein
MSDPEDRPFENPPPHIQADPSDHSEMTLFGCDFNVGHHHSGEKKAEKNKTVGNEKKTDEPL